MLTRIARMSYRHRRSVLAAWAGLLVTLITAAVVAGGTFEDAFELPSSDAQRAANVLEAGGFDSQDEFQARLVVHPHEGSVTDPDVKQAVGDLALMIVGSVEGATVISPYEEGSYGQISEGEKVAFADITLAEREEDEYEAAVDQITELVTAAETTDLQLELSGERFADEVEGGSEGAGLLAAIVILLIAFGSVIAMGLPILTALFGIGTGVGIVVLLANVITMPTFTVQLVLMVGIGVGIDYALLIVTRYRAFLGEGYEPEEAVAASLNTAGRSVLFAGATVIVSVLGLVVVGLNVNQALGIAMAAGVATTMLAALTLLPAVLGFVGRNIDRLGLPHRHRSTTSVGGTWYRWSRLVQRRPALLGSVALVLLVSLALPAAALRLGFADAGTRPIEDTTRRAYDLLAEGFGPGINGPLYLAADVPDQEAHDELTALVDAVSRRQDVASISPAILNEAGSVAFVEVVPTSGPQNEATSELVQHLRSDVIPQTTGDSGLEVFVGGAEAAAVDFATFTIDRLPVFIGAVLVVSFLVLVLVFRSLLAPLKAVVMNLLSVGAAYGVIVAVFQWGWGLDLIGGGSTGPVEAWVPIMLFAIVFGLSMDYEVFLLTRIREEYDKTHDNSSAVADGLSQTARVISAAAAVMVVVFAGFVLSADRSLQMFGLGLATAVFVDATVVRLVLVPSTMELLGDKNWWLPRWLERALPRVDLEGGERRAA